MKKTAVALALTALFAVSIAPSFAHGNAKHKAPAKPAVRKKIVSAVCPVMGTKVPDVSKAAGKTVYKGKTYYFCCDECKPAFDKNPSKYAGKKAK
jgi:YHS domain-containing protein